MQVVKIENKRHFVELEICDTDFTSEPVPAEPPLRRSIIETGIVLTILQTFTFQKALAGPDNEKWSEAMQRKRFGIL